jgi:hypothetical protein
VDPDAALNVLYRRLSLLGLAMETLEIAEAVSITE